MSKLSEFKKFFLYSMIGALAVSAFVSVVAVLIGSFTEIIERVLLTLFMVVIHSVVCMGFIYDDEKQQTFSRLSFFINTIFLLIVLSFITSIFGIWKVFSGEVISELYKTFFMTAFLALHGNVLAKALHKKSHIDKIIYANFIFMGLVYLMLIPSIFIDNATIVLGELYFRILGAAAIVDGTLSIMAIIFYRIFIHKNPTADNQLAYGSIIKGKKGLSIWVWLLLIFLALQVLVPILVFIVGMSF